MTSGLFYGAMGALVLVKNLAYSQFLKSGHARLRELKLPDGWQGGGLSRWLI